MGKLLIRERERDIRKSIIGYQKINYWISENQLTFDLFKSLTQDSRVKTTSIFILLNETLEKD